jgi:hypothetical protein
MFFSATPLWRGTQGETKSMKIGGIKMFLEINLFAFQNVSLCNSPLEGDTGGNEINENWSNKNVLRDQFICIPKCFSLQLPLWRGTQGETKSIKVGGIKMFLEINLFAFQNVFLCNSPFGGGHRGKRNQ